MQNIIFYYSATGNCLNLAINIGKGLENAKLYSMRHTIPKVTLTEQAETIGFVFPVHFHDIPKSVYSFVENLTIRTTCFTYVIVSYGRSSGTVISNFSKILEKKGRLPDYRKSIKCVNSDLTGVFGVVPNQELNFKVEKKMEQIIADILQKRTVHIRNRNPFLNIYLKNGFSSELKKANGMFAVTGACDECGICERVCGTKSIKLEDGKVKIEDNCELCLACIQYCPNDALDIKNLTSGRERYHHPFVSSARIECNTFEIRKGEIIEQNI